MKTDHTPQLRDKFVKQLVKIGGSGENCYEILGFDNNEQHILEGVSGLSLFEEMHRSSRHPIASAPVTDLGIRDIFRTGKQMKELWDFHRSKQEAEERRQQEERSRRMMEQQEALIQQQRAVIEAQ